MSKKSQYDVGSNTIFKVSFDFGYLNLFKQWYVNKGSFKSNVIKSNWAGPKVLSTPNLVDSKFPFWNVYKPFLIQQVNEIYGVNVSIDLLWVNEYNRKSYINLHNHPENHIVSVGYVKVDDKDSSSSLVVQNNIDKSLVDIPVNCGDVLIFNGNVMHKTNPNMSLGKPRIIIGANFTINYGKTLV